MFILVWLPFVDFLILTGIGVTQNGRDPLKIDLTSKDTHVYLKLHIYICMYNACVHHQRYTNVDSVTDKICWLWCVQSLEILMYNVMRDPIIESEGHTLDQKMWDVSISCDSHNPSRSQWPLITRVVSLLGSDRKEILSLRLRHLWARIG